MVPGPERQARLAQVPRGNPRKVHSIMHDRFGDEGVLKKRPCDEGELVCDGGFGRDAFRTMKKRSVVVQSHQLDGRRIQSLME